MKARETGEIATYNGGCYAAAWGLLFRDRKARG